MLPDVKGTVAAMEAFDQLKRDVLKEQDKATINGKETITRSGFSKIAIAFGVTTEVHVTGREIFETSRGKGYTVYAKARATARSGRYAEANSSCSSTEWGLTETLPDEFVVDGTAGTRATNRAIANLCGGGILSKEEMREKNAFKPAAPAPGPQPAKPVPQQDMKPKNPEEPASLDQKNYLLGLAHKKWGKDLYKAQLSTLMAYYFDTTKKPHTDEDHLNKGSCHDLIEALKSLDADSYVKSLEVKG